VKDPIRHRLYRSGGKYPRLLSNSSTDLLLDNNHHVKLLWLYQCLSEGPSAVPPTHCKVSRSVLIKIEGSNRFVTCLFRWTYTHLRFAHFILGLLRRSKSRLLERGQARSLFHTCETLSTYRYLTQAFRTQNASTGRPDQDAQRFFAQNASGGGAQLAGMSDVPAFDVSAMRAALPHTPVFQQPQAHTPQTQHGTSSGASASSSSWATDFMMQASAPSTLALSGAQQQANAHVQPAVYGSFLCVAV